MIRVLLLLSVLLIVSCDSGFYDQNEECIIRQSVYMVPENYAGDLSSLYPIQSSIIEKGQTIKFLAGYSINGVLATGDSAAMHYSSVLWEIDGEYFNINTFRHTFKNSGFFKGALQTVDLYGDTLTTPFEIYVNAPESLTLDYPYDGYNQISPNQKISYPFLWHLEGIDEWETAECEFFLSDERQTVWQHSLGETDCFSGTNLWGPFVGDSAQLLEAGIDLRNVYYTFYWGIQYRVKVNGITKYTDSSNVFRFTTKFLNKEKSLLYIPINYRDITDTIVSTKITIVSATNDTLTILQGNHTPHTTIWQELKPQSNVTIYLEDEKLRDYPPQSFQVDLPAASAVFADTINFIDTVPPQIKVASDSISDGENIIMYIHDDGTGIDELKLKLILDGEEQSFDLDKYVLPYFNFQDNALAFSSSLCKKESCNFTLQGADHSKNKFPPLYWTIMKKANNIAIHGPYLQEEIEP